MYRGKPPNGKLYYVDPLLIKQSLLPAIRVFDLSCKDLEFESTDDKDRIIYFSVEIMFNEFYHKTTLVKSASFGMDPQLAKLDVPGLEWNTLASLEQGKFIMDTEAVWNAVITFQKKEYLWCIPCGGNVYNNEITKSIRLQSNPKHQKISLTREGQTLSFTLTKGDPYMSQGPKYFTVSTIEKFEYVEIPTNFEDLLGPVPFDVLPNPEVNHCWRTNIKIANDKTEVSAEIFHSLALWFSIIKLNIDSKTVLYSHTVGGSTLGMMYDWDFGTSSMNKNPYWRAMIIKVKNILFVYNFSS